MKLVRGSSFHLPAGVLSDQRWHVLYQYIPPLVILYKDSSRKQHTVWHHTLLHYMTQRYKACDVFLHFHKHTLLLCEGFDQYCTVFNIPTDIQRKLGWWNNKTIASWTFIALLSFEANDWLCHSGWSGSTLSISLCVCLVTSSSVTESITSTSNFFVHQSDSLSGNSGNHVMPHLTCIIAHAVPLSWLEV